MANQISILNARDFIRNNPVFGNYTATSYELQRDTIVLVAECTECGARNRVPWSHVSVEARTPGTVPCINRERHAPVAKAAEPDWMSMDRAQFKKYVAGLPSDVFIKMCRSNPAFAARNEQTPNTYIDRKEAISRKEAAEYQSKRDAQHAVFVNLYYAYEARGGTVPFNFESWLQKPEAERQEFIRHFDLNNVDYKERQLGRLFGRA